MKLVAIVAQSLNGVIGKDGKIPWDLPTDRAFYRRKTYGKIAVMGRRTFESMRSPLPYRRSIVLTRNPAFRAEGVEVFHRVADVVRELEASTQSSEEVFIIGGEAPYNDFLPYVSDVFLTVVDAVLEGDTFFPRLKGDWDVHLLEAYLDRPTEIQRGRWYPHRVYHITRPGAG